MHLNASLRSCRLFVCIYVCLGMDYLCINCLLVLVNAVCREAGAHWSYHVVWRLLSWPKPECRWIHSTHEKWRHQDDCKDIFLFRMIFKGLKGLARFTTLQNSSAFVFTAVPLQLFNLELFKYGNTHPISFIFHLFSIFSGTQSWGPRTVERHLAINFQGRLCFWKKLIFIIQWCLKISKNFVHLYKKQKSFKILNTIDIFWILQRSICQTNPLC